MPNRGSTIIAYHLVWTAYGTWLPNDPRGSGSTSVENPLLADLGELHYGRKKTQPPPNVVREFYGRADGRLRHASSTLDFAAIETIGRAFGECCAELRYTCYACAILADHVHVVIRKHRHKAEEMIRNLQRQSRLALSASGHFRANHPVWTEGGWRGFLNSPDRVRTVLRYVERNPMKSGLPAQQWPFVIAYDGGPFRAE